MALGAIVCWLAFGGCDSESTLQTETLRTSARRAATACRPQFPALARSIESLVDEAERISAEEHRTPPWRRDRERVTAAWDRVGQRAREATRQTRTWRQRHEKRWAEVLPLARGKVDRARTSVHEGAGLGRREMGALERAELHLATAEALARAGDLERAVRVGETALEAAAVVETGWDNLHSRFDDPKLLRQWRKWVEATIAESKRSRATAIIVDKLRRQLHIYDDGLRVASYAAELGANGLRPKNHAGDRATPEGRYQVVETRQNGATKYYKALLLSYPNAEDQVRFRNAQKRGTIPARVGIGSLIEVHGAGGDGRDWTDGCVALANGDMDKVFKRSYRGMPVTIVGTF